MDPLFVQLYFLINNYIIHRGYVWWKMPAYLIMAYTYLERSQLMDNNLFDSYPDPLPETKQRCNDPVLGTGYIGCYVQEQMVMAGFINVLRSSFLTPEKCVIKCKDSAFPYAALFKGKSCLCGNDYPTKAKARGCDCRKKCKSNKYKICGGTKHVSLYKTFFCSEAMKAARTIDGVCNDLDRTAMGSRYYRLGRNFNHSHTVRDVKLLEPNPRIISRKLLRRDQFKPAKWLNLLALAWVQFMTHDWFDHGQPIQEDPIEVPLERDDPLYGKFDGKGEMLVKRTRPDTCKEYPTRTKSFQNDVTHWWDASQIYGSDKETNERVRAMTDGKLKVDEKGFIPIDTKTKIEITGFSDNWWIGLSLLHNVFTREHNSICDMLKGKHPEWSDQKLYDTARLINSALIARIHVMEWTPSILNEKYIKYAVNIEWFGILAEKVISDFLKINVTLPPESIRGNIGEPKDFGKANVPFSITEEFVAVYRLHSLLPDHIHMRSMDTGEKTGKVYTLPEVAFEKTADVLKQNDIKDILYTFGTENPGQLVLNNFPVSTSDIVIPKHQGGGGLIDLATIDIIRDRERGIPRYNEFRRLLRLKPLTNFTEFDVTSDQSEKLKEIYNNDVDQVDLLVGCLAEKRPSGFGFGETAFQLFLLMANRRMMTDRFFTDDFKAEYYTEDGIKWVQTQTMKDVLLRAFPDLTNLAGSMKDVETAFFDWNA